MVWTLQAATQGLYNAISDGFYVGISGGAAMMAQVSAFMWLHTVMKYQYRFGTGIRETFAALWKDGGFLRFYRGYSMAIINAPISRAGSTAANKAALTFLDHMVVASEKENQHDGNDSIRLPTWLKTIFSASVASAGKIFLTPLDMVQTSLQVGGRSARSEIMGKIRRDGVFVLWHGSAAIYLSSIVSNFSWFCVYNTLSDRWKVPPLTASHNNANVHRSRNCNPPSNSTYDGDPMNDKKGFENLSRGGIQHVVVRDATIGICASFTADIATNSFKVLKTHRQTTKNSIGYAAAFFDIMRTDGFTGPFTRGLKVRIFVNGCQGAFFTIMWNGLQRRFH